MALKNGVMGGKSLSGFFDPYGTGKLRKKPRYEMTVEELANDIKIGSDESKERIRQTIETNQKENDSIKKNRLEYLRNRKAIDESRRSYQEGIIDEVRSDQPETTEQLRQQSIESNKDFLNDAKWTALTILSGKALKAGLKKSGATRGQGWKDADLDGTTIEKALSPIFDTFPVIYEGINFIQDEILSNEGLGDKAVKAIEDYLKFKLHKTSDK